jgi:hypothetical protein
MDLPNKIERLVEANKDRLLETTKALAVVAERTDRAWQSRIVSPR